MPWLPRAITLDLDDTLWPVAPAIDRAEAALGQWLAEHAPATAARWPLDARRRLRDQVEAAHPELAHDFSRQRLLSIEHMLADGGEDVALAPAAFEVFFAARCEVELYADTRVGLEWLAARVPLAAISNGNACLQRIGLAHHFAFQLSAREHGCGKPAASIFHEACRRLGVAPADVLHVGDDPRLDVVAAMAAGLRAGWINRHGGVWPRSDCEPDCQFSGLAELAGCVAADVDAARLRHTHVAPDSRSIA